MTGKWWNNPWSLVEGCTPVSAACDRCWLATMSSRFKQKCGEVKDGRFTGKVRTRSDRLDIPLRTHKPTTFAIWSDMFHEDVPIDFIAEAYNAMCSWRRACTKKHDHDGWCYEDPEHTYLILTKRADRMARVIEEELPYFVNENWPGDTPLNIQLEVGEWPPPHVWHGTTVEDQATADERIPHLLKVPGKLFLSVEPLLGPVNLEPYLSGIQQVIVGGETGHGARPMNPDWVRSLRDQCEAAGVPFFFKGWGRALKHWVECSGGAVIRDNQGNFFKRETALHYACRNLGLTHKIEGRLLDGREHNDLAWRV